MLTYLLLVLGLGWAADPSPTTSVDRMADHWSALRVIDVETDLYREVEQPFTVRAGPMNIKVQSGIMVPVFSGRFAGDWQTDGRKYLKEQRDVGRQRRLPDREDRGSKALIGFVLVDGQAEVKVAMRDRADGQVLANRLVRAGLTSEESMTKVAAGRALSTTATEGLFLMTDGGLRRYFLGSEDADAEDEFAVVVYGDTLRPGILTHARQLLKERLRYYDDLNYDVLDGIAWERASHGRHGSTPRNLTVVDMHTSMRFGYSSIARKSMFPERDKWLASIRDDHGFIDGRRRWSVRSIGVTDQGNTLQGLVSGVPHPPANEDDPLSGPKPEVRLEPVGAQASVVIQQHAANVLTVDTTAKITVRAVGGTWRHAVLELPRQEYLPNSWRLVSATLPDGTNVVGSNPIIDLGPTGNARDTKDDDDRDDRDSDDRSRPKPSPTPKPAPDPEDLRAAPKAYRAQVTILLPEGLKPGEEVTLHVRWEDTWQLGGMLNCGGRVFSLGNSTSLQSFLPVLPWHAIGQPWPYSVQVAVPAGAGLQVALSGGTESTSEDKGWQLIRASSKTSAAWPQLAVGKWKTAYVEAAGGQPAVRAHLYKKNAKALKTIGPWTRAATNFYAGYLPDYPVPEVDVFDAPRACHQYVWVAPHGMVQMQQMLLDDQPAFNGGVDPDLAERVYAHELAHQYWGHLARPASAEDMWIAETMSETFACMFIGAAKGAKACGRRHKAARELWERMPQRTKLEQASLSRAYAQARQPDIVYQYGPYVFQHMLQHRLGHATFHGALDVLMADSISRPVTTEALQHYLEEASGKDLDNYFNYWVHNGFIPELELRWWVDDGRIAGQIDSDVPFGTLDVPVIVHNTSGEVQEFWIDVKDGQARFIGPSAADVKKVQLDPTGLVLARKRKVHKLGAPLTEAGVAR